MKRVGPEERYLRSQLYEQLTEHVFISELLQEAWYGFGEAVEVLRPEIDATGYDVVLECCGIIRHVQLKTSAAESKTPSQKVRLELGEKPSGCVVWVVRNEDSVTNRMALSYRFFGGAPGEKLPAIEDLPVGRHTKPNADGVKAERPSTRLVRKSQFDVVGTTPELLARLFGPRFDIEQRGLLGTNIS